MSIVSASPRAGNKALVTLPRPTARVRLNDQGWTGDLGEHAEFEEVVAWAGRGTVYSPWHNDPVDADDAEAFASCLLVACSVAGMPEQAGMDSAAAVTIPLPKPDPTDSESHEPGYTYFGRVAARGGDPMLLVDGEFIGVREAWSGALKLIAAGRIARRGCAA
ncbi:hypothetical protein [Nocardia sp. NPDC051570]|uniref:hypothetical protein n=1 Tax=Nocardia sp. NPDC051570 TaxID=3364324 RepID=UPI0037B6D673